MPPQKPRERDRSVVKMFASQREDQGLDPGKTPDGYVGLPGIPDPDEQDRGSPEMAG